MSITSILLAAAVVAVSAPAAEPTTPLASHVEAWAKTQGAGAVVVAQRAEGTWRYALGGAPFADGHAAVPPERILFEIGSISKVFTGLLLAHGVRDGKLALTDTLAMRLPVTFDSAGVGAITLKQLATHSSCLPRLPTNLGEVDASDPYSTYDDAKLFEYLAHATLEKAPPCDPDYSNLGFATLGVVLERAYGKPWDRLVREKITGPLRMNDTAQQLSAAQQARFAQAWAGSAKARPWTFKSGAGAGALRSTAADMAKFADALLAGAKGPLKDVWPFVTGDEIDAPGLGGRIGLALIHERVDGEESYWHDGGTGGFRSSLRVVPASGRATVVLASNAEAQPDAWLAAWRAEGRPPVARSEIAVAGDQLDAYAGVYVLAPQARFTVLRVGDGLRVRLTGQPFLPVFASAADEFFYKAVDARISFQRGADGTITGLTLHQNGRELAAPRGADPVPALLFPSADEIQEYAGTYDFGAYQPGATLTVTAQDDLLAVQLSGQPPFPVFATAKDRFELDVVVASLTFERGADGKIVAVVLHQNGADMRSPRK